MRKLLHITAILLFLLPVSLEAQTARQNSVLETMLVGAVAKMQTGDLKTAISHLEYLEKNFPGNDAVNYYLAQCYAMTGRMEDAERCLQAAIQADSTNVWYQDYLANIYLNEGKGEKSAEIFLDLMEKYPAKSTNAYTLTLLGNRALSE